MVAAPNIDPVVVAPKGLGVVVVAPNIVGAALGCDAAPKGDAGAPNVVDAAGAPNANLALSNNIEGISLIFGYEDVVAGVPKADGAGAPNAVGAALPKALVVAGAPNVLGVVPNAEGVAVPNPPKVEGVAAAPNAGVDAAPNAGAAVPNAGVVVAPNAGVAKEIINRYYLKGKIINNNNKKREIGK